MSHQIKLYWEMTDEELGRIYDQARKEGALDLVAYDAAVSRDLFMLFARRAEVFGAVHGEEEIPLGFFYLNAFEGRTARMHFCFLAAGRPERREIGRTVLKWCFATFDFECLVGIVPAINRGAVAFALEAGGRRMGEIPGCCWIEKLKRTVAGVQFLFPPPNRETKPAAAVEV